MHVRKFKGLFLEILTAAKIGGVHLFADPKIDKDANRWFTADANTGIWFEEIQEAVGPDTAVGAACAFFDAAHRKVTHGQTWRFAIRWIRTAGVCDSNDRGFRFERQGFLSRNREGLQIFFNRRVNCF